MNEIQGIFPALVTPFKTDGGINFDVFGDLVDMLVGKGVNGFYVGGSTGECFLLSQEERMAVLKAVAEANNGRVTLIGHIGAIATHHAIELAECAEISGYTAVSAIPPFYYKFSLAEICDYYRAIMEAASLPMIVYNFPDFSGVSVNHLTAPDLLADDRVIGVKHTSFNLYQLDQMKQTYPDLRVLNGHDEVFLGGLSMGADGAVGSTFNFMAERFVKIQSCFAGGDMLEAQKLQQGANNVIAVLEKVGVFPGVKYALRKIGVEVGECRKPFGSIGTEAARLLDDTLAQIW